MAQSPDIVVLRDANGLPVSVAAEEIPGIGRVQRVRPYQATGDMLDVAIGDGPNLDAFSRLRVSQATALFSSTLRLDAEPLLYEAGASGTGTSAPTFSSATRMLALSATTGTGAVFVQSYEYIPYQAGRSQLCFFTFVLGAAVAGTTVDVGLFDADNGIMFRQAGDGVLSIVRRSSTSGSVVEEVVAQSAWNLDTLNGLGASGITLNVERAQILVVDAQFLGMGRVRCGFDIGGKIVYFHEFRNANTTLAVPYMQQLTLPVQMLLTTTALSGARTTHFKCANVSAEGGFAEDLGYTVVTPEGLATAGNGTRTALLSVRPATTFAGVTNRTKLIPSGLSITATGNSPILWELVLGATFSVAPTWAAVNATYSAAEYSSAPGTLSGVGLVIASGYVMSGAQAKDAVTRALQAKFPISLDRAGAVRAMGTLTLCVTGIGGTSASRASLSLVEFR
jgi:hypothetical protein